MAPRRIPWAWTINVPYIEAERLENYTDDELEFFYGKETVDIYHDQQLLIKNFGEWLAK